jgi:mRNA interferase MazF
MVSSAAGQVVLVPFPFSDLSESKLRPAVVLADAGRGDWILCQVTSKPYGDPRAIPLGDEDFSEGSLKLRSFARPGKLFTASSGLMVAEVGMLKDDALSRVVGGVIAILQGDKHETTAQPAAAAERQAVSRT